MNYIVFDLEWNQGNERIEKQRKEIPFEIIEIGAVRLNGQMEITGEFSRIIRPQVYRQMHPMTKELLHIDMEELQEGESFPDVMEGFLAWCGQDGDYRFATWGPQDLTELQRNMNYFGMKPLSNGPIRFYDVQKLYAIAFEEPKIRRNLEHAVDSLQIAKDVPFHRAFGDAYYTARVFERIKDPQVLQRVSFDSFQVPQNRKDEIHIVFDDYAKYISRRFEDKAQLLADKEVSGTKCYLCHRNLKRKIRWFTPNGKHYYSLSLCPKHGYMKGKIRVRRCEGEGVYAVKTTKFISEEEAQALFTRKERAEAVKKMKGRTPGE